MASPKEITWLYLLPISQSCPVPNLDPPATRRSTANKSTPPFQCNGGEAVADTGAPCPVCDVCDNCSL